MSCGEGQDIHLEIIWEVVGRLDLLLHLGHLLLCESLQRKDRPSLAQMPGSHSNLQAQQRKSHKRIF